MAIICDSATELQTAISQLVQYCENNHLTIKASKTKVMIFHKGRLPKNETKDYFINSTKLEIVNNFKYLGITFSTQLSFTKHLQNKNAEANARIAYLFSKYKLSLLPISLVMRLFNVYILPLYTYALPIWITNTSVNAVKSANAVQTKYLKRYLGLPKHANNSIVHHITETKPLFNLLTESAPKTTGAMYLPTELSGYQLEFLKSLPEVQPYNYIEEVPTWFWISKRMLNINPNYHLRKKFLVEIFDLDHKDFCSNNKFHCKVEQECICRFCDKQMTYYHHRFCNLN